MRILLILCRYRCSPNSFDREMFLSWQKGVTLRYPSRSINLNLCFASPLAGSGGGLPVLLQGGEQACLDRRPQRRRRLVAKLLSARRLVYCVEGRTLLGIRHPPATLASRRYFGLASARGSERFHALPLQGQSFYAASPCAIALRTSIGSRRSHARHSTPPRSGTTATVRWLTPSTQAPRQVISANRVSLAIRRA